MSLQSISQNIKKDSITIAIMTLKNMALSEKKCKKLIVVKDRAYKEKSKLFDSLVFYNIKVFSKLEKLQNERIMQTKQAKKLNKKLNKRASKIIKSPFLKIPLAFFAGLIFNNNYKTWLKLN